MWKLFDQVTVLYEGRQIFFGQTSEARTYFEELGFECKITRRLDPVLCLLVTDLNTSRPRATDNTGLPHLSDQPEGTSPAARV